MLAKRSRWEFSAIVFWLLVPLSLPSCTSSPSSSLSDDVSLIPVTDAGPSCLEDPDSAAIGDDLPDFSHLYRKASPSVVNVSALHELSMAQDALVSSHGVDRRAVSRSLGSGFVFDKDGYIVTCSSVVQGGSSIQVSFAKGAALAARVIARDDISDLAVLKVEKRFAPPLPIASEGSLHQGDWVGAFGYPYGLSRSLTVGVVSAIRTKKQLESFAGLIISDAAVNPGCNGGPLLNVKGEVVGINLVSSRGDEVLGLAVPIHDVWALIQTMKEGRAPRHAWLGVSAQYVDESLANAFGLGDAHGALISKVLPASPAAKAGLRRGDVVTRFAVYQIDDPLDLVEAVSKAQVGTKVYVELFRDSVRKKISVIPTASIE